MTINKTYFRDILAVFIIVFLVLLFRRYDAFTNAQFFTEDSTIFFQQFLDFGANSVFKPYNGYIHLLPRLVAFAFGELGVNYKYVPFCYNMSAFAITFFVAVSLYFGAVKLKLRNKLLYATFFLFLPIGGEVFMNITHIIWVTSVYLINFMFVEYYSDEEAGLHPKPFLKYFKVLTILVFSFSGTCSLLISPAILLIFILERKRLSFKKALPLLVILFSGLTQFILIKFVDVRKPGEWTAHDLYRVLFDIFNQNTADIFFLHTLAHFIRFTTVIGLLMLIALFYAFVKCYSRIKNKRKYVIVLAGLAFFVSALAIQGKGCVFLGFTVLHNDPVRWAHFDGWFTYQRYLFIPYLCIAWIFVVALDGILKTWHICAYLIFTAFHYRELKNNLPDLHWKEQIQNYYNEGKKDTILTSPTVWGYKVILPDKKR